jgi:hypothetical protein
MRVAGNVVRKGDTRRVWRALVSRSNLKRRGHFLDLGQDGRIILKWVLKLYVAGVGTRFIGLGITFSGGFL